MGNEHYYCIVCVRNTSQGKVYLYLPAHDADDALIAPPSFSAQRQRSQLTLQVKDLCKKKRETGLSDLKSDGKNLNIQDWK